MSIKYILPFFLGLTLLAHQEGVAQEEVTPFADQNIDDLGNVSDQFQEDFYEALKQKGIENYDRALEALASCIEAEPNKPILYFERGKNQAALKQYDMAAESYLKTLSLKPNSKDVLEQLYEVYYKSKDYLEAKKTVIKLIKFDIKYKEDLAKIYALEQHYDEALDLLDTLDQLKGKDYHRERLRERIYKKSGNRTRQVKKLTKDIAAGGTAEDYLKLIYVYSDQGNTEKAYETALALQKLAPKAAEPHIALYKINLSKNEIALANQSVEKVIKSPKIPIKTKGRVVSDFLKFLNQNPQSPELSTTIDQMLMQASETALLVEIGNYYIAQKKSTAALAIFEKAYATNPNDYVIIKNLVLLYIDASNFEKAKTVTQQALAIYPSQPLLYLTLGAAHNGLGTAQEAIDALEVGLDFVIDNPKMEADYYNQFATAYTTLGEIAKAAKAVSKLNALKSKIKNE